MTGRDPQFDEAISILANALQVALPLAERQARISRDDAADAENLAAAVTRAAQALRQLQPNGGQR